MTSASKIIAAAIVGCLLVSGGVYADPIKVISADDLDSWFNNSGGDCGIGTLLVSDTADIVVEYVSGTVVFAGGNVFLTSSLFQDLSAGGIADGLFVGGSLELKDSAFATLLSADITQMELKEQTSVSDVLVGVGTFTVTGGSLAADFGGAGTVYQLMFNVDPSGIQNFTDESFSGASDLKLSPIPEPATLLLVGTGALMAFGLMRRRRMTN